MSEKKNIYNLNMKEMRDLILKFGGTLYGRTVFFLAYFLPFMAFLALSGLVIASFFAAEDKHIGFCRSHQGQTLRVYVNRSGDPWDIPAGKVLLGTNLQTVAPDWLTIGPRGFCLVEE